MTAAKLPGEWCAALVAMVMTLYFCVFCKWENGVDHGGFAPAAFSGVAACALQRSLQVSRKLEQKARCYSSSCGGTLQLCSWMKMVFARRPALVLWRWWLLVREWWLHWWRGVVVMVLIEASVVAAVGGRFGLGFQVCEMGRRWWGVTL